MTPGRLKKNSDSLLAKSFHCTMVTPSTCIMDASTLRDRSVRPLKYFPSRVRRDEGGEGSGVGRPLEYVGCLIIAVGRGGVSLDGVRGRGEAAEESEPDDEPTDSRDGVLRSRRRLGVWTREALDALRKLRKGAKCSRSSDSSMRRS
jgi:hypothetical protein